MSRVLVCLMHCISWQTRASVLILAMFYQWEKCSGLSSWEGKTIFAHRSLRLLQVVERLPPQKDISYPWNLWIWFVTGSLRMELRIPRSGHLFWWVGPTSNDDTPLTWDRRGSTEIHKREAREKAEVEMRVMHPQVTEHRGPLETGRGTWRFSARAFGGGMALTIWLMSDFRLPGLWENTFLLF